MFINLRERERERERTDTKQPPIGTLPDQGTNPQPFGVQDDTPINWATQPGQDLAISGPQF